MKIKLKEIVQILVAVMLEARKKHLNSKFFIITTVIFSRLQTINSQIIIRNDSANLYSNGKYWAYFDTILHPINKFDS